MNLRWKFQLETKLLLPYSHKKNKIESLVKVSFQYFRANDEIYLLLRNSYYISPQQFSLNSIEFFSLDQSAFSISLFSIWQFDWGNLGIGGVQRTSVT